jgi:hypothetical protein
VTIDKEPFSDGHYLDQQFNQTKAMLEAQIQENEGEIHSRSNRVAEFQKSRESSWVNAIMALFGFAAFLSVGLVVVWAGIEDSRNGFKGNPIPGICFAWVIAGISLCLGIVYWIKAKSLGVKVAGERQALQRLESERPTRINKTDQKLKQLTRNYEMRLDQLRSGKIDRSIKGWLVWGHTELFPALGVGLLTPPQP